MKKEKDSRKVAMVFFCSVHKKRKFGKNSPNFAKTLEIDFSVG